MLQIEISQKMRPEMREPYAQTAMKAREQQLTETSESIQFRPFPASGAG